jgi:hypothetical protein
MRTQSDTVSLTVSSKRRLWYHPGIRVRVVHCLARLILQADLAGAWLGGTLHLMSCGYQPKCLSA